MNNRLVIAICLAVAVSGCIDQEPSEEIPELEEEENQGLEIAELTTTDPSIVPNQRSQIILKLENYHTEPVEINDISVYNTAFLNVDDRDCSPEDEIQEARYTDEEDFIPTMECRWTVEAPKESIDGYDSRNTELNVNIDYNSKLENSEALHIQFLPLEDIERTEDTTTSYSNNEVSLDVSLRQPLLPEGRTAFFEINNVGEGRIDSDYRFEVEPESIFGSDCGGNKEAILGESVEFDCTVSSERQDTRTENAFFSIYYKYVKSPTLNIEVVNR